MNNKKKRLNLVMKALNLIFSVKVLPKEIPNINNQIVTVNSSIVTYDELCLLLKDVVTTEYNNDFENYEIELKMKIEKHKQSIEDIIKPEYFQIADKVKIEKFSEKYDLYICHANPLCLFIDKVILSYFKVDKHFTFLTKENFEYFIEKQPKWCVIIDNSLKLLYEYNKRGTWTIFLTNIYFNLTEKHPSLNNIITENIEFFKTISEDEFYDATSISFFNQEKIFDEMISLNNNNPNNKDQDHSNKSQISSGSNLDNKSLNENKLEVNSVIMNSSLSSHYNKESEKANKGGLKDYKGTKKQILLFISVLIKEKAFDVSSYFNSSDKVIYDFNFNKPKDYTKYDLILTRINELQLFYYYKDLIEDLKFQEKKLSCNLNSLGDFIHRSKIKKLLMKFPGIEQIDFISFSISKYDPKQFVSFVEKNEYKCIIKFDPTQNLDFNHKLLLISSEEGLKIAKEKLESYFSLFKNDWLIIIVEKFIPHDGWFVKMSILNNEMRYAIKSSLPNSLQSLTINGFKEIFTSDIKDEINRSNIKIENDDLKRMTQICKEINEKSNLNFLGFDFIIRKNKINNKENSLYLIDINYFPKFSERSEDSKMDEVINNQILYILEKKLS